MYAPMITLELQKVKMFFYYRNEMFKSYSLMISFIIIKRIIELIVEIDDIYNLKYAKCKLFRLEDSFCLI